MTKHSISCAEYPLILKSASFRFGTFGGTLMYVIYKDEITAEAVQSPLFSYVTFAKVAKNAGITLQIIEILPYYHNKTGFKMKIYDIDYHSIHAFTD